MTIFNDTDPKYQYKPFAVPSFSEFKDKGFDFETDKKIQESGEIDEFLKKFKYRLDDLIRLFQMLADYIAKAENNVDSGNSSNSLWGRFKNFFTGNSTHNNIQGLQHGLNAQKVALEIMKRITEMGVLNQQQIVATQNMIKYSIKEEQEFRKKLKSALLAMFASVKERFELHERIISDTIRELHYINDRTKYHHELFRRVDEKFKKVDERLFDHDLNFLGVQNRINYIHSLIDKIEKRVDTLEFITEIHSYGNPFRGKSEIHNVLFATIALSAFKKANLSGKDLLLYSKGLQDIGVNIYQTKSIGEFVNLFIEEFSTADKAREIEQLLSFSSDQNTVLDDGNGQLFDERSPIIKALNFATFTIKQESIYGENLKQKVADKLIKLNVDKDIELDWFQFSHEIFNHLFMIHSKNIASSQMEKWHDVSRFLESHRSIRTIEDQIQHLVIDPLFKDKEYLQQKHYGNFSTDFVEVLLGNRTVSLQVVDDNSLKLGFPAPKGKDGGIYFWTTFSLTSINNANKLTTTINLSILKDEDYASIHSECEKLSHQIEELTSTDHPDNTDYTLFSTKFALSKDELPQLPYLLQNTVNNYINALLGNSN